MKKFLGFLVLAVVWFSQTAWAGQPEIQAQSFLQSNTYWYQEQQDKWQQEGLLNVKVKAYFGSWLLKSEIEARANTLGLEQGILQEGELRPFFGVEELYLDYRQEHYQFKVGILKVNWGITDKFNPLDLLNPQDFTNLLHNRKMGQFGLQLSYLPQSGSRLELVLLPFFQASRLPPQSSPFFYGLENVDIDSQLQTSSWGQWQMGLRFYRQINSLELTAVVYRGYDHLPFVSYNYLDNKLLYRYEPMTALGFGWEYAWPKLIVRAEAAYYSYDSKSEENYASYVVGLDYNFGQIADKYNLYLTWQYLGETPYLEDPTWVRHLFTNASSLKIVLSDIFLEISLEGIYNFPNSGLIIIPGLTYSHKDWRFGLEYNYLAGEKDSLWQDSQKANNLVFSIRYSF